MSTTISIYPTDWNYRTQSVNANAQNAQNLNIFLNAFRSKILDCYSKLFVEGKSLNVEELRKRLYGTEEKPLTLQKVIEEHNDLFKSRIGVDYSYGSFKNYKTTQKFITEFLKVVYKKSDLALNQVNYSFCTKYFLFLTTVKTCKN